MKVIILLIGLLAASCSVSDESAEGIRCMFTMGSAEGCKE